MKKIWIVLAVIFFASNSALSLPMNGTVSKDYDFGFETAIRHKFGNIYRFSKIFEKNDDLFYQKRFCPVYLLSMKDMYSVIPTVKSNIEKRKIPNTYTLSFKGGNADTANKINFSKNDIEKEIQSLNSIEKTSDFSAVQKKYQKLIAENPDRIELLYKYAQFLYTNYKYPDAIAVLNDIVAKDESFVLASYTLGNIYYDLGEYANAVKANMTVIKKNPFCADAYFNIASSLEKMHKFSLAIDYYNKCLSLNANDTQAQNALKRLEQLTFNAD